MASQPATAHAGVTLRRAYRECARIVRRRATNFYLPLLLLPPRRRRALFAIYAFCRHVDDAVDGAGDPGTARQRLATLAGWLNSPAPHSSRLGTHIRRIVSHNG